jgi:hypothetical protein
MLRNLYVSNAGILGLLCLLQLNLYFPASEGVPSYTSHVVVVVCVTPVTKHSLDACAFLGSYTVYVISIFCDLLRSSPLVSPTLSCQERQHMRTY